MGYEEESGVEGCRSNILLEFKITEKHLFLLLIQTYF